jgi:hypothetical protein
MKLYPFILQGSPRLIGIVLLISLIALFIYQIIQTTPIDNSFPEPECIGMPGINLLFS